MARGASHTDYKSIADNLIIRKNANGSKVFLIASSNEGEGKTTTAINVAKTLAHDEWQTLLVDLDFIKPEVGRILNLPAATFENESTHPQLQQYSDNLWVMVLSADTADRVKRQFIGSDTGKELINVFRNEFDVILIDTTSDEYNAYARHLSSLADEILIVVKAYQTSPDEVKGLVARLDESKRESVGLVLNKRKEYVPRILQRIFLGT